MIEWKLITSLSDDTNFILGINGNTVKRLYRDPVDNGWYTFDDDDEFDPTHWLPDFSKELKK